MALILDMQKFAYHSQWGDYNEGQEIAFYYPVTKDKGFTVTGTLTRILVNRTDPDEVWFRVVSGTNIEADYPYHEIVLPEDIDEEPREFVVKFARVDPLRDDILLPSYATTGASGFDLASSIDITLLPHKPTQVSTGLRVEVPAGFEMQIRGRSGLGKRGIGVPQGIGTIDSDYRGEIGVLLINNSEERYTVHAGDRVAQGVIAPVIRATLVMAEELTSTERGEGGFGSTGK